MLRRLRRPSKPTVFAGLMALSMVGMLLPERLTRFKCGLVQLLAPLQYPLKATSERVSDQMRRLANPPVDPQQYEQLVRARQVLENQLIALSERVRELTRVNRELARLRRSGLTHGRLIPARVLAYDAVPWRDSLVLDKGGALGVSSANWVTTHRLVDAGQDRRVREGLFVLGAESLIGRIEQVAPYTSRVVLLSDPTTTLEVRIGRFEQGRLGILENRFLLRGRPGGQMWVVEVDYRKYIESGLVRKGDLVVRQADASLPVTMLIGKIVELQRDRANALLCHLRVAPPVPFKDLSRVYIVDPELR